VENIQRFK